MVMRILILMNNRVQLFNDDCLKIMDQLISKNIKVDAVICDPPCKNKKRFRKT
jgi:DNA modification methylase